MYSTSDLVIIRRGEIYKGDILPRSQGELLRKIIIEPGAHVKGSIVGETVELHAGSRVSGGILASEIMFDVSKIDEKEMKKIVLQGDVISTSTITIDIDTRIHHDVIIHVMGNMMASDRIRISNAIVEGNILSGSVDLHNVVGMGMLGITKFEATETGRKQKNTLSNSIFFSIVSEGDIEIVEHRGQRPIVGIYSPFVYISPASAHITPAQDYKRTQKIAVLKVDCMIRLYGEIEDLLERSIVRSSVAQMNKLSLGDLIQSRLTSDECVLYEISLDHVIALAPTVLLEALPLIKRKRGEQELIKLLPLEKIIAGVGETYLEEAGEMRDTTRREVLREIMKARRELYFNPLRARDIEQLFINNMEYLTDDDKNNIRELLFRYPPKIEFESEIKSADPLLLPSKLVCEMRIRNTGVRGCQVSKILAKISSRLGAEESRIVEIDPPPGVNLELPPGENKTINVKIDVDKIGELNVELGLKYVDKIGWEYQTGLQHVGTITAIMPSISEIQSKKLDDEFSKLRIEMVVAINEALNKIATLYVNIVEKPKKEIINSFNTQFSEYVRSTLKGNLSGKLQMVRDQYRIYLNACSNLNNKYAKIVEEIVNEIDQLDKEVASVRDVLVLEEGKIVMQREIYRRLCNIIKGIVKLKWIEDEEFRDLVERLKEQIRSQVLDISDVNTLNLILLMIIDVRGGFEIGFVRDIKERIYHEERRRESIRALMEYFVGVTKLLEELKVDTTC